MRCVHGVFEREREREQEGESDVRVMRIARLSSLFAPSIAPATPMWCARILFIGSPKSTKPHWQRSQRTLLFARTPTPSSKLRVAWLSFTLGSVALPRIPACQSACLACLRFACTCLVPHAAPLPSLIAFHAHPRFSRASRAACAPCATCNCLFGSSVAKLMRRERTVTLLEISEAAGQRKNVAGQRSHGFQKQTFAASA